MPHERINIVPHPSGEGYDIPFPNGVVTVPDTPGGYCISSGCGSGKTESIKSLIRQKHNEGILYAVDTIAECQKMYMWVYDELVKTGIISATDVMMINSKSDMEDIKLYQEHPEEICRKKVLIVVQVRLFIEIINYFVLYCPIISPQPFDGDFKVLMSRKDIRRWIIFDESPLFLKPFVSLTKGELAPFAIRSGKLWKSKPVTEVADIYKTFIKGDRKMDYNHGDTKLNQIKNAVVIGQIPQKFNTWMAQNDKTCNIQYYPSDLVQPGMTSHVLIYEGAGDVLIGNGSRFKLLDLQHKYNSTVDFHSFGFALSRKVAPDNTAYTSFVGSVINILRCTTGKTLIVVWKDFKSIGLTDQGKSVNVERLTDALIAAGVDPSSFSVTYYGASDTKSTNEYRDYTNIILAGRWGLGGAVIDKLKMAFDCNTPCIENYMMWYYVQLLCRIGIRNNSRGTYKVFYSSDHTDMFIARLSVYFNQNIFIPHKIKTSMPLWMLIVSQYLKKGQSSYLKDISALIARDSRLKDAIEQKQPYTYIIPLKELTVICPRKKKAQKDNYRALKGFLGIFEVDLQITK